MKKISFEKHWVTYLAIILIPIILWTSVYDILAEPADNEKFAILFVGDGLDCEGLAAYISENYSDPRMKSISVESTTILDSIYYDYLKTRCYNYDLIIFTEGNMKEHLGRVVFEREIMLSDYADLLPESDYYYEHINDMDIPFGFVVADGDIDNLFTRFYSGDERCCLFLSPRSVNLGGINGEGEKGDDYALIVLRALFGK